MFTKVINGVDISKSWIDTATLQTASYRPRRKLPTTQHDNNPKGFEQWWTQVSQQTGCHAPSEYFICMEHTGIYTIPFCQFLEAKGIAYTLISGFEIKHSGGIQRGKNDAIDARRIARYAYQKGTEIRLHTLATKEIRLLRTMLTNRNRLKKSVQGFKAAIGEQQTLDNEYLNSIAHTLDLQSLEDLEAIKKRAENQIMDYIKTIPTLAFHFDLATSVCGIGWLTAAWMLVLTDNFTRYTDPRKFACYCGCAPFEHSSGSSIKGKTKVSHIANKFMKSLLTQGAYSAKNHDPEMHLFFHRQLALGKNQFSIINMIRNKLIHRVFAVIRTGKPYELRHQHYTMPKQKNKKKAKKGTPTVAPASSSKK